MATNTPLFRAHSIVDDINPLGCYTYEQIANEMTSAIMQQQIHTFKQADMQLLHILLDYEPLSVFTKKYASIKAILRYLFYLKWYN